MVQIKPGAKSTTRLTTVDQHGAPVTTTTQDGIYLAQQAIGEDRPDPNRPDPLVVDRVGEPLEISVPVAAGAAHTYTECARIWNPIHTDKAVALASGLPDIILHGTANLAHGVSAVVAHRAESRPELIRRITCRFAAMVLLPSSMTVRVWPAVDDPNGQLVPFEVLNEAGDPAVKDGVWSCWANRADQLDRLCGRRPLRAAAVAEPWPPGPFWHFAVVDHVSGATHLPSSSASSAN